ncbi:D-glycero-alpha-D-manno-heptose-1,7-bisphosphate 7-phosphatase [Candidatus Latescibacterota bacterium]
MAPPGSTYHQYVLLDRDGVINIERGDYTTTREEWEWAPGALEGLKFLKEAGFGAIVITNQACIAKGLQTEERLADLHRFMRERVADAGGEIVAVYHCPHQTSDRCQCRKPEPGLLLKAAVDYQFNLPETFYIGDTSRDTEAARRAGARNILIEGDWNIHPDPGIPVQADFHAASLTEATLIVITETNKQRAGCRER